MFKLIRVNLTKEYEDESEWEVVIPEDPKRKLSWAAPVANNKLLLSYLEDVKVFFIVFILNFLIRKYHF